MTKSLIIMRPLALSNVVNFANLGDDDLLALQTPNPKEIALADIANDSAAGLGADLGAVASLDTFLLGFTNAPAGTTQIEVYTATAAFEPIGLQGTAVVIESTLVSPVRHAFVQLAAPVASRYWVILLRNATGGTISMSIGVLAVGRAFQCALGHEWGAGRQIEDTGTAERLIGGGFGIDEGVTVGGYGWTFGDLTNAELSDLYALVRAIGQTKTVLVVEDPDQTAGLAERIHWGLFDRLNAYERLIPGASRWEFKIRDWG